MTRSGPALVIDAHTHIFPPFIKDSREAHRERDVWFAELYASPKALLTTAEDLIASMDRAGITRSIACGFPWRDPGLCRAHNDYLAEAARSYPERISWLATVSPGGPEALAEAERAFSLGAAGLGELNADGQNFALDQPEPLAPLVELVTAHRRPILFHVSEPVGHSYPGKGTATPARLVVFLAAFPEVRVAAAHWGGGLPFYELMPEVAELTRNLVYDSAASTYLYRFQIFPSAVHITGLERVMFASDYPILRQDRFLRRVRQVLAPHELEPVLWQNAARFYRLPEGELL